MKSRSAILMCSLLIAIILFVAIATGQSLAVVSAGTSGGNGDITLSINLGMEPPTLDPSLAASGSSINVVEQLFIGLVDIDYETGEVHPELATHWDISPDGTVYTFHLRDDVYWTDGTLVTAEDIRYAILRVLEPATGANYAYLLYIINNALEFNAGLITDPNQVGIFVINSHTLQITLKSAGAYFPSILGLWVARPLPKWVIDQWGDTWTDPEHIVTNGAYKLAEWSHDNHIILEKNPGFFDVASVQIDQVKMWMITSSATAWSMYLDGFLDTAEVPLSEIDNFNSPEKVRTDSACSYYYGYTNTKYPFNDVRVRKAFTLATNRWGLIQNTIRGAQTPATSFAPPGIFGAPEPGAVGLEYNPGLAQDALNEFLTEKNMTLQEFNDLDIVLMHNTSEGHARIASAIENMWIDVLGVEVRVEHVDWSTYLDLLRSTAPVEEAPHIWRFGWCMDYPDENNWVHEIFNSQAGANRLRRNCLDPNCGTTTTSLFDQLTVEAQTEQDPQQRVTLYHEAERILSEVEAAYLPIYHYGTFIATKPYLERTYGLLPEDIASWRITRVMGSVEPSGGELTSYDGKTHIVFPAGSISQTTVLTHTPTTAQPTSIEMTTVGQAFDLTAVYSDTGQPAQIIPGSYYTLTVQYSDEAVGAAKEDSLVLAYWGGDGWIEEPTSVLSQGNNTITATPDHFSLWAIIGETELVLIPVIQYRGR